MFGLNKIFIQLAIASAAVVAIVAAFHFYKESVIKETEQQVIEKVITEDKNNYIKTRKRIDEAISTDRSVESATDRLRARQERRRETD